MKKRALKKTMYLLTLTDLFFQLVLIIIKSPFPGVCSLDGFLNKIWVHPALPLQACTQLNVAGEHLPSVCSYLKFTSPSLREPILQPSHHTTFPIQALWFPLDNGSRLLCLLQSPTPTPPSSCQLLTWAFYFTESIKSGRKELSQDHTALEPVHLAFLSVPLRGTPLLCVS